LKTKAIDFGPKIVQFPRLFVQKLKKIEPKMLANDVGTSSAGLICHANSNSKLDFFASIVK
jgi:hypothetical protein